MDKNNALNQQQLDNVITQLQSKKEIDMDDFVKKNLTTQQSEALKAVLEKPELIKNLLSTPKAQALVNKILSDKNKKG